jgi:hypothetical protein
MLQYTMGGNGARFALIVHHTDAVREWAYDRESRIGHLDKALDEAQAKGWTVVDMKNDWKTISRLGTSEEARLNVMEEREKPIPRLPHGGRGWYTKATRPAWFHRRINSLRRRTRNPLLGVLIADDDEGVALNAFDLEPILATARAIRQVDAAGS